MKTTKRHFAIFRAECRRLEKLWGISGWAIYYQHGHLDGVPSDVLANTRVMLPERAILVSLTAEIQGAPSDDDIRSFARHEMIHVLLEPMQSQFHMGKPKHEQELANCHEVLNRLERVLPR